MEKYNGMWFDASRLAVRYGTEENIENEWKKIVLEKDKSVRNKLIDTLVERLSNNSNINGFFSKNEIVDINTMKMQCFKLDDLEIYYSFFDNLAHFYNKTNQAALSILKAIIKTEGDYFGCLPNTVTAKTREKIAKIDINTDEFIIPSIKSFKGLNCAACVEYASLSHNLWLLAGVKSHYVLSKDVSFDGVKSEEGHAFVIVDYKGKFLMCDLVNSVFNVLNENPIEKMLNGEKLVVNNIIYSNASIKGFEL